jgi:hypothetical protein
MTPDPNAVLFWRFIMGLVEEADAELCAQNGVSYQPHDPAHLGLLANIMALRWGLPESETWMARLKEVGD